MNIGINKDISEYKESLFFGLRNYLYEEHGIFINLDKKESVATKLQERMEQLNINAINEYLYLLDRDSGNKNERNKGLSINQDFPDSPCSFIGLPEGERMPEIIKGIFPESDWELVDV